MVLVLSGEIGAEAGLGTNPLYERILNQATNGNSNGNSNGNENKIVNYVFWSQNLAANTLYKQNGLTVLISSSSAKIIANRSTPIPIPA